MSDERAKKVGAAIADAAKATAEEQAKADSAKAAAQGQAKKAGTRRAAAGREATDAKTRGAPAKTRTESAAAEKAAAEDERMAPAAASPAGAAPAGTAATDAARTAADAAAAARAREEEAAATKAREAAASAAANDTARAAAAEAEAAAANRAGAEAEAAADGAPRSTRERIADGAFDAARLGARGVQAVSLAGLRAAMPLIELYAERRAVDEEQGDQPGRLGLTLGEERVLKSAAQKAMVEMVEITSRTDPVFKDAPAYNRISTNGESQAPNLAQLLTVAAAANRWFERDDKVTECEPAPTSEPPGVAYVALAPGEYHAVQAPLTPTQARRSAMRERSYNMPQPAMLVQSEQGWTTAPATAYRQDTAMMAGAKTGMSRAPGIYAAPAAAGACGSCGGGKAMTFPPARYDEDGSCSSLFDISCETRWRIRECFKVALCDLLRCLGEELCDDGRFAEDPDLGACLERFACSILTCLPEAICPSGGEEICCLPAVSCGCNFAVGE